MNLEFKLLDFSNERNISQTRQKYLTFIAYSMSVIYIFHLFGCFYILYSLHQLVAPSIESSRNEKQHDALDLTWKKKKALNYNKQQLSLMFFEASIEQRAKSTLNKSWPEKAHRDLFEQQNLLECRLKCDSLQCSRILKSFPRDLNCHHEIGDLRRFHSPSSQCNLNSGAKTNKQDRSHRYIKPRIRLNLLSCGEIPRRFYRLPIASVLMKLFNFNFQRSVKYDFSHAKLKRSH